MILWLTIFHIVVERLNSHSGYLAGERSSVTHSMRTSEQSVAPEIIVNSTSEHQRSLLIASTSNGVKEQLIV